MARVFNGTTQYCEIASVPVSAWPVTFACWAYCTDNTIQNWALSVGNGSSTQPLDYAGIVMLSSVFGQNVRWQPSNGGAAIVATSVAWTPNTWHHVCGSTASNTSHAVWLDGGHKGTASESVTFPTLATTTVGSVLFWNAYPQRGYFAGSIVWPAIWSAALTDDEVASLAAGAHPLTIRPESLVFFAPLGGLDPEHDRDIVGGLSLTATNSPTWSDDSPTGLIYPSQQIIGVSQGIITPPPQYNQRQILRNQRLILK